MKNIILLAFIAVIVNGCASSKETLILDPSQSMSITGKGPGQDAAINPFGNDKSVAVVKNIGDNIFEARVQNNGRITEIIAIEPSAKKEIPLEKGTELYFDSNSFSKAQVYFKKRL